MNFNVTSAQSQGINQIDTNQPQVPTSGITSQSPKTNFAERLAALQDKIPTAINQQRTSSTKKRVSSGIKQRILDHSLRKMGKKHPNVLNALNQLAGAKNGRFSSLGEGNKEQFSNSIKNLSKKEMAIFKHFTKKLFGKDSDKFKNLPDSVTQAMSYQPKTTVERLLDNKQAIDIYEKR